MEGLARRAVQGNLHSVGVAGGVYNRWRLKRAFERRGRNGFAPSRPRVGMATVFGISFDPVLVGFLLLVFLFVLGVYLLLRRTVLAFQEGVNRGR